MNHLNVDVEADIQAVIAGECSGHPSGSLDLVVGAQLVLRR
jgi:hypothetical protein